MDGATLTLAFAKSAPILCSATLINQETERVTMATATMTQTLV